jgi:hypothetical protein
VLAPRNHHPRSFYLRREDRKENRRPLSASPRRGPSSGTVGGRMIGRSACSRPPAVGRL